MLCILVHLKKLKKSIDVNGALEFMLIRSWILLKSLYYYLTPYIGSPSLLDFASSLQNTNLWISLNCHVHCRAINPA